MRCASSSDETPVALLSGASARDNARVSVEEKTYINAEKKKMKNVHSGVAPKTVDRGTTATSNHCVVCWLIYSGNKRVVQTEHHVNEPRPSAVWSGSMWRDKHACIVCRRYRLGLLQTTDA